MPNHADPGEADATPSLFYRIVEPVLRPLAKYIIDNPRGFFLWLAAILIPIAALGLYAVVTILREMESKVRPRVRFTTPATTISTEIIVHVMRCAPLGWALRQCGHPCRAARVAIPPPLLWFSMRIAVAVCSAPAAVARALRTEGKVSLLVFIGFPAQGAAEAAAARAARRQSAGPKPGGARARGSPSNTRAGNKLKNAASSKID